MKNHAFGFRDREGVFHEFYGDSLAFPDEVDKSIKIVLTIAHLDHTPENCSDSNLKHSANDVTIGMMLQCVLLAAGGNNREK